MERYFDLDMPALRFARNTLVASLLALLPLLLVFVWQTPGFGPMLAQSGPALRSFLRQVLTNGLPVVFAVNYLGFFLFAWGAAGGRRRQALALLIDVPLRIAVFVALHAVIYVLSADWFGSFGGNRATALEVVPTTLARSALFDNLSGVYLYATMASALPLYAAAFERSNWRALPTQQPARRAVAVALAVAVFGVFVLALTALAAVIVRLEGA